MTVAKLIKLLQKADPKAIVILASDSEGNSYSPAGDTESSLLWHPKYQELKDPSEEGQYVGDDEEPLKGGKKAFVIWP